MLTFQFKQFSVIQEKSPFRITTDSVVLGAWMPIIQRPTSILDIGSGTGVLSLMQAQNYPEATIHAVEINPVAYQESKQSFLASKWGSNLTVFNQRLQDFKPLVKYDFIISNPPYFSNSEHNQKQEVTTARHTVELSFQEICSFVVEHINKQGVLAIVLPAEEFKDFVFQAGKIGLHVFHQLNIKPKPAKQVHRVCALFTKEKKTIVSSELIIRELNNQYTKEYIELTKSFYLHF